MKGTVEEGAPLTLAAAAFHEAGHAVVALAIELPIRDVGVELDAAGRPEGWCDSLHRLGRGVPLWNTILQIAQIFAGIVAERMAVGIDPVFDGVEGYGREQQNAVIAQIKSAYDDAACPWGVDARLAVDSAFIYPQVNLEGLLLASWEWAEMLLRHHWASVDKLARLLLQHGHLDGQQVYAAVGEIVATVEAERAQKARR